MGKVLFVLVGLALALAGVVLMVWLLWWLWKRHEGEAEGRPIEIEVEAPPPPVEVKVETVEAVPVAEVGAEAPAKLLAPDDLVVIEGIGPKISGVLQAAGITTFAQLADTAVSRIEEILEAADPRLRRLANPATWPEQAALAAGGQWDALEALQNELKGGRRG
jgi:predicted flap endonuclease-1-like 5' DNA nuclease